MRSIIALVFLAVGTSALAQQPYLRYSAGTGFFINREGHVITNAHVVKNCERITLYTPAGEMPASLVASDSARDLAVLKSAENPQSIAPMRWNIDALRVGDPLYLYGFPGEAGAAGTPTFSRTRLTSLDSLNDTPERIQLERVVRHGNSGGPVIDGSGNVIGVISAYVETYTDPAYVPGAPQRIGAVDIAITLAALRGFLDDHQIPYYQAASGLVAYAEPILERNAAHYVFRVRCLQGVVMR